MYRIDKTANTIHKLDKKLFSELRIRERLENKRASRIKTEISADSFSGRFNEETYWEELVKWYRTEMTKFHKAVAPFWDKVQQEKTKQA